jgi:catechol 2,3-dioxygenase
MSNEQHGGGVGHVHLTVSDLTRSVQFYTELLEMEVMMNYGNSAVFLSYDGYHHHLGLNTWAGEGVSPQPAGYAGLYHFALVYPTRKALARIVDRLMKAGYIIDGASDHGVSEAVYLRDPDGIGVELYVDRPKGEWSYSKDGDLQMQSLPLSLESLLREL